MIQWSSDPVIQLPSDPITQWSSAPVLQLVVEVSHNVNPSPYVSEAESKYYEHNEQSLGKAEIPYWALAKKYHRAKRGNPLAKQKSLDGARCSRNTSER